jgi:hypothetical protein
VWCCVTKETQPTVPFFCVLPSRLHLIYLSRARPPPTFWLSAIRLCVVLSPQTTNVYPTVVCFTNTSFHSTTILPNPLLPNPCCAPYTLPLGSTPVTHPPCHTPNPLHPLPLLLPLPFTIIHAPIWCRGRSRSIGPRAACSLSEMPSGSCTAYATTRSGLSSTPPPGNS